MSTDNNSLKGSFYQGTVLVIIPTFVEDDVWQILQTLYIDTADDTNIKTVFESPAFKLGSTVIQSTLVKGFNSDTKKVRRTFKIETGLEYWEAM